MKPEEFIPFLKREPEPRKWIIVTNNIDATNAFGEMSHVWMVNFYQLSTNRNHGFVAFDEGDRKIIGLTHWKYA